MLYIPDNLIIQKKIRKRAGKMMSIEYWYFNLLRRLLFDFTGDKNVGAYKHTNNYHIKHVRFAFKVLR